MENNEEAIIELQTKLSFQEDLLESLNQVITDQQGQITRLERTVAAMIEQMHGMQSASRACKSFCVTAVGDFTSLNELC